MAINKHYTQLEYGSGRLFEYSKEEKEGYEKHVSTKGNTSYRKYYDEISGELGSVSIYDGKFGKQLSFNIKNGDDVFYVPFDIRTDKGNVNTYCESVTRLLPNLEKGDNITLRGYNFTPEGERYAKVGVSIKKDGEKVEPALSYSYYKDGKLVEGDVPAIKWTKEIDPLDKSEKNVPDPETVKAKNNFFFTKIAEQTERLKWIKEETPEEAPTPKQEEKPTPEKKKPEPAAATGGDSDKLPF